MRKQYQNSKLCQICEYNNFPIYPNLKYHSKLKDISGYYEDIFSYKCLNCRELTYITSNILDTDYSINEILWNKLGYKLLDIDLPNRLDSNLLKEYLNEDFKYYKIYKDKKNNLKIIKYCKYPSKPDIYIALPRNEKERFLKLNIFVYHPSNLHKKSNKISKSL